ncbi:putative mucin TcMUCII [Trypanosoma cruzi]|uniref:Putative mucin TcMUCII n=1 Tax=Trypanosoma cruzi TaxID=5693 RepID=A0A7J6XY98_TRYCR|nr:putative mucin TcMUCII [Trypanosoma cruzi]
MMLPGRRRTRQHSYKPLTGRLALMEASIVVLLIQSRDYRWKVSQGRQARGPLRENQQIMRQRHQALPVRKTNQMKFPVQYSQMVRTVRQSHQVSRILLQTKQIRGPKLLPRRPQQRHQPRRPRRLPPPQRHQVLRLQRRQPRRPPAHRHVCAKWTAASAALRGCVPRCCSPYPRWRTPLWAEEVYAGCACQHSTTGICARPLWSDVNKYEKIIIALCFLCFSCPAVCSALLPVSVTLNASQTHSYARHAYKFLRGRMFACGCIHNGVIRCSGFY